MRKGIKISISPPYQCEKHRQLCKDLQIIDIQPPHRRQQKSEKKKNLKITLIWELIIVVIVVPKKIGKISRKAKKKTWKFHEKQKKNCENFTKGKKKSRKYVFKLAQHCRSHVNLTDFLTIKLISSFCRVKSIPWRSKVFCR